MWLTAYLSSTILARRQLENAHVCHGQSAAGAFAGDDYQSQICNKGAQYPYWHGQEADKGIITSVTNFSVSGLGSAGFDNGQSCRGVWGKLRPFFFVGESGSQCVYVYAGVLFCWVGLKTRGILYTHACEITWPFFLLLFHYIFCRLLAELPECKQSRAERNGF